MSGLEKSRFVDLSKTEEEELSCSICMNMLNDPMVTPCCRQTYCGNCIKQWLRDNNTCPNDRLNINANQLTNAPRIIVNLLNKLKVCCNFRDNGCDAILSLETLANHILVCQYNPEAICAVCGEKNGVKSLHNCNKVFANKIKLIEQERDEMFIKFKLLESDYRLLTAERNKNHNLLLEIKTLREHNQQLINHVLNFKSKLKAVIDDSLFNELENIHQNKKPSEEMVESNQSIQTWIELLPKSLSVYSKIKIVNFSKFSKHSETVVINGVCWLFTIEIVNKKMFNVYLRCLANKRHLSENCYKLEIEFKCFTQNEYPIFSFVPSQRFSSSSNWGYGGDFTLDYVMRRINRFVGNDTIIIELSVISNDS